LEGTIARVMLPSLDPKLACDPLAAIDQRKEIEGAVVE
jgi:hypothetical protein